MITPRIISLFAGCGGLDYGFKQAGFEIVYANDKEISVKETYEYNLNHELDVKDIYDVDKSKIPQGEVIIAGIPCQPFSNAGKRLSTKSADGNLFLEVIEVIKNQKQLPRAVIFENVRGFLSSKDSYGIPLTERFSQEMGKFGYKTTYMLLNAADYGVPSNRYRVFIVSYDQECGRTYRFPAPHIMTNPITVGEVIAKPLPEDEIEEIWSLPPSSMKMVKYINEGGSWKDVPYEDLSARHQKIKNEMKKYRSPNFYRRFSRNEVMGTVTATSSPENSGIIHPLENRRYSVREIARFQSYPDHFKFIGHSVPSKYKMIGNSVPPRLAYEIAESVRSTLFL